jgi:hypothetical protein
MMNRALALLAAVFALVSPLAAQNAPSSWRFAVSGDSRNCGDVVMPLIANSVLKDGASFYWHLGDFRKTYDFDEDMVAARGGKLTVADYLAQEWDDFIAAQLKPFGSLPVYLGIGNHETVAPKTRAEYLAQFADWLDAPALRAQRLADDPDDRRLKTYFHWKQGGADFFTLDNATPDQFDAAQLAWFEKSLARDAQDPAVRVVIVGMHEALPNSVACGHSMNDSPLGVETGRRVYRDLLKWKAATGKKVQVLASHSHYVMENVFDTPYWSARQADRGVLPGWIVGTGGAVRYALPDGVPHGAFARAKVYGYLLADVAPDGDVAFAFHEVRRQDVPDDVVVKYGAAAVDACFAGNADGAAHTPSPSCSDR